MTERALSGMGLEVSAKTGCRRPDVTVAVHYSWECLRRAQQAVVAGKTVYVHSVLVPTDTEAGLVGLARSVAPTVYTAEADLIRADCPVADGVVKPRHICEFVVGFPVSRPLVLMQPPFLVLDDLNTPFNVGEILRNAYHFGVTSVLASRAAWSTLTGRAARASMGWLYHFDFHHAESLAASMAELRRLGVRCYGAENYHAVPVAPHRPPGDRRWALVLGNEARGISAEVTAMCDSLVCVPQQQGESLNVAHAATVCLYELSRHLSEPR